MTDSDPKLTGPARPPLLTAAAHTGDMTSPVDLPPLAEDEEETHSLRWASIVIATATAFLAVFNASAIQNWAFELTPSARTEPVVRAADGWYQQTARFGLNLPVETMHGWWMGIRDVQFGGGGEAAPAEPAPAEPAPAEPAPEEEAPSGEAAAPAAREEAPAQRPARRAPAERREAPQPGFSEL